MRQILANLGAANATVHRPHLPERFGVHHSKVGVRCSSQDVPMLLAL